MPSLRRGRLAVPLMLLAAFGPYLAGGMGLRWEQIVAYGVGLMALSFGALRKLERGPRAMIGPLLAVALWLAFRSALAPTAPGVGSTVALLDNLLLPVAATVAAALSAKYDVSWTDSVARWGWSLIGLLSLNALLAGSSQFLGLSPFLGRFWGAGESATQSVAYQAAQLGRFTGIFNQPFEAGMAYSIALLAWVFLHRVRSGPATLRWIALLPVTIGGLYSISKVFILVGVPLAFLYMAVGATKLRSRWLFLSFLSLAGGGALWVLWLMGWSGLPHLARFLSPQAAGTRIALFSAGRLGADGELPRSFGYVWEWSPLTGFGTAPAPWPLDSQYLQFWYYGGLVGLLALAVLSAGVYVAYRDMPFLEVAVRIQERQLMFLFVWALVALAAVGGPALTGNRISVMLWTLVGLLTTRHGGARASRLRRRVRGSIHKEAALRVGPA